MSESWATAKLTLFPETEEERRRMVRFAQLWSRTTRHAESLGWKWNPGSIIQLYMESNPASLARQVFVSPNKPERFLVRVAPMSGLMPQVTAALQGVAERSPQRPKVKATVRDSGEPVVDVRSTRLLVLGSDSPSDAEVERRLEAYVAPFLSALQRQS